MITNIHFKSYKKLQNINIPLQKGINVIAGNNGTCKSSLLHVISNTYQVTKASSIILKDNKCLKTIKYINKYVVPKIETLNKGSMKKNDPANGVSGPIYTVTFDDGSSQAFRRHVTADESNNRYYMKPYYKRTKSEAMKEAIVIYLSLDRLFPFAEFPDEDQISKVSVNLPLEYLQRIQEVFKMFTSHEISIQSLFDIGKIKKRYQFHTNNEYIDSNTISSGEDNLLIMLIATYSLVYYIDSLKEEYKTSSTYLLIDEYDASLHPEFQVKFLKLFKDLHSEYSNLNLVLTTHSLTTIEESLKSKFNVVYLQNRGSHVSLLNEPDMKKIKVSLHNSLSRNLYQDIEIPIISEDKQARAFIERLFRYRSNNDDQFKSINQVFKLVDISMSSNTIKDLFHTKNIPIRHLPSIGILDGDQTIKSHEVNNRILTLPGKVSPERLIHKICKILVTEKGDHVDLFWDSVLEELGFSYDILTKELLPSLEDIDSKISALKLNEESTKGIYREESKKIFIRYEQECKRLYDFWINHPDNKTEIEKFFLSLQIAFYKVCEFHGLTTSTWIIEDGQVT